jgi:hypothetical protein
MSNVVIHPNCVACEICSQGVVCMVIDSVLLCEQCCEVLGVSPAAMQPVTPAAAQPARAAERLGPSLEEMVDALVRGAR